MGTKVARALVLQALAAVGSQELAPQVLVAAAAVVQLELAPLAVAAVSLEE
jgi:hypothetical protein